MSEFQTTISKEALAALPSVSFGGEIVVVDSPGQTDRACNELPGESLLGFDTESRSAFRKGVVSRIALLRLSTQAKCHLFRLNRIRIDKGMLNVLESIR